jgi:hypothetical protein
MTALQIRNRIRFAQAQQAWDDMLPAEPESDAIEERYAAIDEARQCLTRAARHLEKYEVALADQAMADAMGALVP